MLTGARFPDARMRSGMYESFYLRAVSPDEPVGVWIRHTVHKAPGRPPLGSVWCTVFDARRKTPYMHKLSTEQVRVPDGGWIALAEDAVMGPGQAHGSCGAAGWSLRFSSAQAPLQHLSPAWLYRMPLPRTKLTSPMPAASFDGRLELAGESPIELRGWPGMVGHNWGSEHAERWIWLHGIAFQGAPEAWLDVALARVRVAGRLTPWVAAGALSLDGRRHHLGGLAARGVRVAESVRGCSLQLAGEGGVALEARVEVPPGSASGWRYADPDGGLHDVINCSIAALELTVSTRGGASTTLRTDHCCAYELGMATLSGTNEQDHGVPIALFPDG